MPRCGSPQAPLCVSSLPSIARDHLDARPPHVWNGGQGSLRPHRPRLRSRSARRLQVCCGALEEAAAIALDADLSAPARSS
jgi:hypothetical protein